MIVIIEGAPTRQFHRPGQTDLLDFTVANHALLVAASPLRDDSAGETANITVEIENRDGAAIALFAVPPIGAVARLVGTSGTLFTGVVERIALDGDQCTVEIGA